MGVLFILKFYYKCAPGRNFSSYRRCTGFVSYSLRSVRYTQPFRILHAGTRACSDAKIPIGDFLCAGKDSNLRRINPGDLQSPLVDRLSTDAYFRPVFYILFITNSQRVVYTNSICLPLSKQFSGCAASPSGEY